MNPFPRLFVGLHQPSDARHFPASFISVNRLRARRSDFVVNDWVLDSGAFTSIFMHGGFPRPVSEYADQVRRWARCGNLVAKSSEDYMCEPLMLAKTGKTIADHQRLTIERYDALLACDPGAYILPVLQGYDPADYVAHVRQYGDRLAPGAWVGVGSVCKRNGDPRAIEWVLYSIKEARPDLLLHGFGLKQTALGSSLVAALLHSADSMAWSFAARAARHKGDASRNQNNWREAEAWSAGIRDGPKQLAWTFTEKKTGPD